MINDDKEFLTYHLIVIILGIIILVMLLNYINTNAYIIASNESIKIINTKRMKNIEKMQVKLYVKRWSKQNSILTLNQKVYKAIKDICKLAEYKSEKHNPSDVLKGFASCQGYSLMLKELMDYNDIGCRIILNDDYTHMYNQLLINEEWMDIDITAMKQFYK